MRIEFLIMSGIGVFFGIFAAYFAYLKKSPESKKAGWMWAIGSFLFCVIFFNVIMTFVDISNDNRKEEAFEVLDKQYKEQGDKENESLNNVRLSIKTDSQTKSISHYIYVGNYNNKRTYKGKVHVELVKDNEVVEEYTTKSITIKPGEKQEVTFFKGPRSYDSYRWEWEGTLR
ncbi:lipopolysaccharide export LptBFGC system permease protein LptF [Fictibacillus halophilus]|uniref:Lipopolysaccharide export LptBFGC system permease protein LptF n=1 Tax=Fictibacillus halophilus TaxID=1610490 RepID=A0ABV2LNW2_9BACL|nr:MULTISPECIES: hypothetical protein [Fictibacillus]MED1865907.1 hypothetical protein [Fictibacillus nanhaiensis]